MQLPLAPVAPLTVRTCLYPAAVLISWESPAPLVCDGAASHHRTSVFSAEVFLASPTHHPSSDVLVWLCSVYPRLGVQSRALTGSSAMRSPPARRGHLLIQAPVASVVGLAAFLGASPCPSQPSLWNVSDSQATGPAGPASLISSSSGCSPIARGPRPFQVLAASFSRARLGAQSVDGGK